MNNFFSISIDNRPLSNTYKDGKSEPRGGQEDSSLPSARLVSSKLHHEPPNPNNINLEDSTPHQVKIFIYDSNSEKISFL